MYFKKGLLWVLAAAAFGYGANGAQAASEPLLSPARSADGQTTVEQFQLARAYYTGNGATQDHVQAREMFATLAGQGLAPAQYFYAYMLIFGQGGAQDPEEGIKQLQLAVVAGNSAAMALMGDLYRSGEVLDQDDQQAAQFYRLAANLGLASAQNALGAMYNQGAGVMEDPAEAVSWFSRAADQGFAPAMRNLAALYFNGRGVARDPARAYAWLELALRNLPEGFSGRETILQIHERMEANLTPEALAEANAFVEAWTASPE